MVAVADASTLRSEHGELVDKRIVGEDGTIGFSGLDTSKRYFVRGYQRGKPLEVRARALTGEEASELGQSPILADYNQPVGTQEEVIKEPPPSPPEEELGTGIQSASNIDLSSIAVAPDQSTQESSAPDGAGSQPEASSAPNPTP